ncbi:MAG: xylulokinase [Oscillospiraceae bacterium]|nr:xylulokinase [Oscillospiraceae bacterium]
MSCFLGIDAGTSGIKAMVLDERGAVRGSGHGECGVITPYPGWAEQSPEDWWRACDRAVRQAVAESGLGADIKGIGLSGQMQGLTMVDKGHRPIGNCIIWLDQRSGAEVEEIYGLMDGAEMLERTANFCFNSFWAPKLLWMRKNRPEDFGRIHKAMFAKDYLRLLMTGEVAAEVSDASLTLLMDVRSRRWSREMFDRLGLPFGIAPERLLESAEVAGPLRAEVADGWGLAAGTPVVAGAGDQPAGGVGTGIVREGMVGATIGTSGVVFGCSDRPFVDDANHGMYSMAHAMPGKWCYLGLVLSAGGALKWLRDAFWAEMRDSGADVYGYMDMRAERVQPGSEGLTFLPYLNGENTPHPDGDARGVLFGLSLRHGVPEICRSVMEGVAFAMRDCLDVCRGLGIPVSEVRANGGGARSALWRRIQADVYGADLVTMNMEEGPAAGGAILAAVGAGHFNSVPEACDALLKVTGVTSPIPENVRIYEDYYQTYRSLYPSLKGRFAEQARNVRKHLRQGGGAAT